MNTQNITKESTANQIGINRSIIKKHTIDKKKPTSQTIHKVYATGKRKTAIAKIWMSAKGSGKIIINRNNTLGSYFKRSTHRMLINQPFNILKLENKYDVNCQVLGSGLSGQAGAIRHAISKALMQISEEFHKVLRNSGFLTRDSRQVERKKYGQAKARKKFQFSKR